jgi:hypothetical protein
VKLQNKTCLKQTSCICPMSSALSWFAWWIASLCHRRTKEHALTTRLWQTIITLYKRLSRYKATKYSAKSNGNSFLKIVALRRQFFTLASGFVKNMQHKNIFILILSLGDLFTKSYPTQPNIFFNLRVVFSKKSGKMYILPFATFVAFWRVSLLCCFLTT